MRTLWAVFPLLFYISTSLAVLVNVTIDDTLGDLETGTRITYTPEDAWSDGRSCTQCTAANQLDRNMIYDGTWHDGIFIDGNQRPLLASVPFYGSAVYIYCILSNTKSRPNGNTDIVFLIDNQRVGNFTRRPSGDGSFEYNTLVFSDESLTHGIHTLTIQNGRVGGERSLILLDYITYSYENGQSAPAPAATNATSVQSSSPDSPTNAATQTSQDSKEPNSLSYHGRIVGGILGSFGIILLGLVAFLWYRQGKSSNASINLTPPLNRSRSPGAFPARWAPSWRWKSSSVTSSRASFNPNKFIDPVSYGRPIASAPSPPVVTVLPVRPPPRPDAASTLEPNRPISVPAPVLDARNEQSEPRSIIEWRRRTQAEAEAIPPNLDENMSSFYEFSSNPGPTVSPPSPPHPRRSALRHFTVVNN